MSTTIELCNSRSICNKLNLLANYTDSKNDLPLLFLTETWLNSKYVDAMCCPPGYDCLRSDRNSGRGGGVMVLYKPFLNVNRINVNSSILTRYLKRCVNLSRYHH